MTYKALYREWRPLTFDDIVEQKHVVQTLKNAVSTNMIGHAYLFCGTRGTGKTSSAHIMAKSVNCENPIDGNPCNKCDICKGISSETIGDVLEIDAASNNSVNNIRELREEVKYLPSVARYKVYIIDEVHMLSTGAFNALLKTLEEPPEHVIFILATTEPHKLPATILSRCQRFDFRQISVPGILSQLKKISSKNDVDISDKALRIIARKADGALRDAISLFDQCISSGNKKLTENNVIELLGTVNDTEIINILKSIIHYDINNMFILIDRITSGGKKTSVLLSELILYFRNMLVIMSVDNPEDMLDISKESIQKLKQLAKNTLPERIIFVISELSKLENQIKWVALPKVVLEAGLTSICIDKPIKVSDENLQSRIKNVEMKLDNLKLNSATQVRLNDNEPKENLQQPAPENITQDTKPESVDDNIVDDTSEHKNKDEKDSSKKEFKQWKECMDIIFKNKTSLYYCLVKSTAYKKDNAIIISNPNGNQYIKTHCAREDNIDIVKKAVKQVTNKDLNVKFSYTHTDNNESKTKNSKTISKMKKISEALEIPFDVK